MESIKSVILDELGCKEALLYNIDSIVENYKWLSYAINSKKDRIDFLRSKSELTFEEIDEKSEYGRIIKYGKLFEKYFSGKPLDKNDKENYIYYCTNHDIYELICMCLTVDEVEQAIKDAKEMFETKSDDERRTYFNEYCSNNTSVVFSKSTLNNYLNMSAFDAFVYRLFSNLYINRKYSVSRVKNL